MADIYEYLKWRGDLSFARSTVNPIDTLIFSILSYLDFPKEEQTIAHLAKEFEKNPPSEEQPERLGFFAEIPHLLDVLAQTKRYATVRVHHFAEALDQQESIQFASVVFTVQKQLHVVAFRGTDTHLVGWKEDLLMSFMEEVPAQKKAATFLQRISGELEGKFILTGHSKGGNLAVYAGVQLPQSEQKRVSAIYNHDGPGFHPRVIKSEAYQRMIKVMHTYIPQSSIVGILLEHGGNFSPIASSQVSILQHDPFSWKIEGTHFMVSESLSKGVLALKEAIRSWLNQVSPEERSAFVEAFCELISATGAETLEDLSRDKLQSAYAILRAYTHMSKESRRHLKKSMDLLFEESRKSFAEKIFGNFLSKKKQIEA
jgi:hypothetical protein